MTQYLRCNGLFGSRRFFQLCRLDIPFARVSLKVVDL